jgi:hypothetical protein
MAHGAPTVKLHATVTPEHLGQPTTLSVGVQIQMPDGSVPPPLIEGVVRYPAGVDIGLSELGQATCNTTTLVVAGPKGCAAESIMGQGTATGELQPPLAAEVVRDSAVITVVRTAQRDGKFTMLFDVEAYSPIRAQVIIPALIEPAPPRFGGQIEMQIPLVETWPYGPDVAVTQVNLTFGPRGLTYYEHVRGKLVAYHPRGIRLPDHCPHGGFPFNGTLTFLDGSHTTASTSVPCPRHRSTD